MVIMMRAWPQKSSVSNLARIAPNIPPYRYTRSLVLLILLKMLSCDFVSRSVNDLSSGSWLQDSIMMIWVQNMICAILQLEIMGVFY